MLEREHFTGEEHQAQGGQVSRAQVSALDQESKNGGRRVPDAQPHVLDELGQATRVLPQPSVDENDTGAMLERHVEIEHREIESELQEHWDYIYEPSAADLLDGVLMRYIESQVYRAAMENVACEMAARMVAMKSASDNAGTLIDELQLIYNKARQAAITQEITEIVGGAAAV